MEEDKPQVGSDGGNLSFSDTPIDVRKIALIDPSTYVAPSAETSHALPGKVRQRRTRQRLAPVAPRTPRADLFHRSLTEHKLFQAVSQNDLKLVERMLEDGDNGLEVSKPDKCGRTPLHVAAAAGNNDMVRLLLSFGANPSIQDQIGNTPLHLAACTSKITTVTILLSAGTDISLLDCRGNTPLQLAQSRLRSLRRNCHSMSVSEQTQAVEQIAYMMREYSRCVGDESGMEDMFDITAKLSGISCQNEVSEVAELLEDFTSLKLKP